MSAACAGTPVAPWSCGSATGRGDALSITMGRNASGRTNTVIALTRILVATGFSESSRAAVEQGRTLAAVLVMGRVAERIVRLAPCPVLTVHAAEPAAAAA